MREHHHHPHRDAGRATHLTDVRLDAGLADRIKVQPDATYYGSVLTLLAGQARAEART